MNDLTPTFSDPGEPTLDDEGTLIIEDFTRRRFDVEVVKVTLANMSLAAQWCGGEVIEAAGDKGKHIKVPVHRPLNQKQTEAFPNDRILKGDTGFKVYIEKAFIASFTKKGEDA